MPGGGKLDRYDSIRDFKSTPEPAGRIGGTPDGRRRFVVQRHRATRAALGHAPRGRRRAGELGGAARAGARPGPQVARRSHRGPPLRLRVVRGRHPERLRQGRRGVVGRRLVGARPGVPRQRRSGRGDRRRRAEVRALRAKLARALRDHQDVGSQRASRRRRVAADPQARQRGRGRAGIRRIIRAPCSAGAPTTTWPPGAPVGRPPRPPRNWRPSTTWPPLGARRSSAASSSAVAGGPPTGAPGGHVVVRAPAEHGARMLLRIPARHGRVVALVDQQPLVAVATPVATRRLDDHVAPAQLAPGKHELQLAGGDRRGRIVAVWVLRVGLPPAVVPQHHVALAVAARITPSNHP